MPVQSMTGFAARSGVIETLNWALEARSVNSRGLDLKLRFPDRPEGLDAKARNIFSKAFARGSITIALKLTRDARKAETVLDDGALEAALVSLAAINQRANDLGTPLAPSRALDVVTLAARFEGDGQLPVAPDRLIDLLIPELTSLATELQEVRGAEGRALETVVRNQIADIANLAARARAVAAEQDLTRAGILRERMASLVSSLGHDIDEARVAQEIANVAVKADITEELDRVEAHVEAARVLLESGGPVGRKLDFLMQEFNREANTLCSKSTSIALTEIGLALKSVIDQMREQIQNLE